MIGRGLLLLGMLAVGYVLCLWFAVWVIAILPIEAGWPNLFWVAGVIWAIGVGVYLSRQH